MTQSGTCVMTQSDTFHDTLFNLLDISSGIPSFIRFPKGYILHSLYAMQCLWMWCPFMGMTRELINIVYDIFYLLLLRAGH